MSQENQRKTRLQKLSGSDFEIQDGQPDIRGWKVKDENGRRLGEVEELIFDYQSRKVRYIVLDLEDNELDLEDKEVLVPIGIVELHGKDDDVMLPGVSPEQLRTLPEYHEDHFDTEHETSVRNVFGGLGGAALTGGVLAAGTGDHDTQKHDEDFYSHRHFNEENLYRNRRSQAAASTAAAHQASNEEALPMSGTFIPGITGSIPSGLRNEEGETVQAHTHTHISEEEAAQNITLQKETEDRGRNAIDIPGRDGAFQDVTDVQAYDEVPVANSDRTDGTDRNEETRKREESLLDPFRTDTTDAERNRKDPDAV